ncbi:unnamed protein product [Chrysoparadoxa australica]
MAKPSNPTVYMTISIGSREVGQLVIELFANRVPKTAENFRALCTGEKGKAQGSGARLHYRGSFFHRIIPGFMAQGGDFTKGDGTGGMSVYGETFNDESFAMKHDRAGLLSMANCGPNTNGSQFFLTFAPAKHLDGKHVVFGRVTEGLEVLKVMERVSTGAGDRPRAQVTITDCGEISAVDDNAADSQVAGQEKAAHAKAGEAGGGKGKEKAPEEVPEEEEEEEEEEEVDTSNMTAQQKKLFQLRLKINAGRKANKAEVKEEYKRLGDKSFAKRQAAEERKKIKDEWEAELKARGLTTEEAYLIDTAESSERLQAQKAQKQRNLDSFAWASYSSDALFKAYENRLVHMPKTGAGGADAMEKEIKVRSLVMPVDRLWELFAIRYSLLAHKAEHDAEDITHINDKNRDYNKRIKKAYDKYTVEIRQNLERGTAL